MVAYKSSAVIGAGMLGTHIVSELLKQQVSLKVFTHDDTKPGFAAFKENGATIVKVDYSNEDELKKALSDIQVVYVCCVVFLSPSENIASDVSTVGMFALESQIDIAKAAKAADVQLFVPSEFGIRLAAVFTYHKKVVQNALKELDLPYTLFYSGFFSEYFPKLEDFDFAGGKVRVVDTGDVTLSKTSFLDVARFAAHTLTTAEPSDLMWAKIPMDGDRKNHKEIAAIAEKKFDEYIQMEYVDVEETRKKYTTDIGAFFLTAFADGDGVSGPEENVKAAIAKFYPDWNPKPIDKFIQL